MNVLVVGLSYRTAPVSLLERVATSPAETPELLAQLLGGNHVDEAMVLSTCNRVEVYAGVSAFHGALSEIADLLSARAGVTRAELADHLYVYYDTEAAQHAFRLAAGLDSMVVGENQVLGQLRDAYAVAVEQGTPGRLLHELAQHALRAGKRVRAETGIDRAGQNAVTAALRLGAERFGAELAGRPALVVGAGAMGSLALANLRRAGVSELLLANRNLARAARLATAYEAVPTRFADLGQALRQVDVVVSATASSGHVLSADLVAEAAQARGTGRPLLLLDLALPRDIDPAAADLPGVALIGIEQLAQAVDQVTAGDLQAAEAIIADELDSHLAAQRSGDVAPTVAALRSRADDVVSAELRRLRQRRPDLTDEQRSEVAHAVHRVVQQLLHHPSVRIRQLASEPGGARYADALRELFGLDLNGASAAEALNAPVINEGGEQ
ncbi:MAG: glutamyl-tRNA reductase [Micromonosporaceae bacterium]